MPNRETRTSMKVVQLREPATLNSTGSSAYVDLRGWDAVTFVADYGDATAAAGTNTLTGKLEEYTGDTPTTASNYSDVATADMGGSFTTIANGVTADVDTVAYRGKERYVRVTYTLAGTASAVVGVLAILTKATREPANALSVTTGTAS